MTLHRSFPPRFKSMIQIPSKVQNSVRGLPRACFFNGNLWSVQWPGDFQNVTVPEVTGSAILAVPRAGRLDCQLRVPPEAEGSVDQRQFLPAIQLQVIPRNTFALHAERALSRGPARNSGVRRAVRDARVDVPPAKFDLFETKITAPFQLAQQFLAADSFGLQMQGSRRCAGQTLGDSPGSG